MAERVQRRRTAGWRMPANTVYVGRPSKWGNPFPVVAGDHAGAVAAYRRWLAERLDVLGPMIRAELAGRDLACWCPPGRPCHADVLLAVAASRSPLPPDSTPEETNQ